LNAEHAGENAGMDDRGSLSRLLAVSLVALGLTGCGQDADRQAVRTTTQRFLVAYAAHENATACQALSADAVKELESQESAPCRQSIGKVQLAGGSIAKVELTVTNAKVDLAGGDSVFLSEQADGWKITALGCHASEKPADQPFDCELTA
jgi:hypothetical protein